MSLNCQSPPIAALSLQALSNSVHIFGGLPSSSIQNQARRVFRDVVEGKLGDCGKGIHAARHPDQRPKLKPAVRQN